MIGKEMWIAILATLPQGTIDVRLPYRKDVSKPCTLAANGAHSTLDSRARLFLEIVETMRILGSFVKTLRKKRLEGWMMRAKSRQKGKSVRFSNSRIGAGDLNGTVNMKENENENENGWSMFVLSWQERRTFSQQNMKVEEMP